MTICYNKKEPSQIFQKDDKVVIVSHLNDRLIGDKGTVIDSDDKEYIIVKIDQKNIRVKVNEQQLMAYNDLLELATLTGMSDEDFTSWDDLPALPDDDEVIVEKKCSCSLHQIMWGGCACEYGKIELMGETNEG